MKVVTIDKKNVIGFTARTENNAEISGNGKIPALWESFMGSVAKNNLTNFVPVGVYWNYESDMNAKFNVTAGIEFTDKNAKAFSDHVTIQAGKYLQFSKEGKNPEAVIELWQEVWQYFSNENSEFKRAYITDFELYTGLNAVEIYISIL